MAALHLRHFPGHAQLSNIIADGQHGNVLHEVSPPSFFQGVLASVWFREVHVNRSLRKHECPGCTPRQQSECTIREVCYLEYFAFARRALQTLAATVMESIAASLIAIKV